MASVCESGLDKEEQNSPFVTNKLDILHIKKKKTERKKKKENQEKLDPTSCDLIVE